jgi:hypothetical protein
MGTDAFWRRKRLDEMTRDEWEALCDGCAQCCRVKLEDADTGDIGVTDVVCDLLDSHACRCTDYHRRRERVADCIAFGADEVLGLRWLPETCAYRLVALGEELPAWHHLVCGDRERVHHAGGSVRGCVVPEAHVHPEELESRIVHWIEREREGG